MDLRTDRLSEAANEVPLKYSFTSLESALGRRDEFSGVAVCSPPKFHVAQSLELLKSGLPILLEKPVSPDLESCRLLHRELARGGEVLLGYTYRWWPPVKRLKAAIESGVLKTLRHARFVMSAHLADWHPWEPYQEFFMASRELGGGALLDESHFIDLMIWFFGVPEKVFARVEKISDLEIETDDLVDVVATYADGPVVTIHLDLFGRPHEKQVTVVGEGGTVKCLFDPHEVRIGGDPDPKWAIESFPLDRNEMFLGVDREFLSIISGGVARPTCTIEDGLKVLEVIEACRESQRTNREIGVKGCLL
jgi:predicted dehydrogenase